MSRVGLTVILVGRIENGATESKDSGASNDVDDDVLQAAADVVINRHNHSIAAQHSATHDISLRQQNGRLSLRAEGGLQSGELPIG